MQLTNLTPTIGSEVLDLDLATASAADMQAVKEMLHERLVLVFRDQQLTRERHKELGSYFGTGTLHRHALTRAGDPDVLVVKTDENSKFTAGEGWHTDVSCDPNPISASMLYITEVPGEGGGDTLFANMQEAYEMLSDPIKELILKLAAVHDGALPYKSAYGIDPETGKEYARTTHPLVVKHPVTGRNVLWINSAFTSHIKGVGFKEGKYLMDMLLNLIESTPRLQCRVQWAANTLVMWDNVATQHHAVWDYFPQRRYGERVSSVGVELAGAA